MNERTKIAGVETPVDSCPVRLPHFARQNCRKQEGRSKKQDDAVSCTSKRFNRAGCSMGNISMKAEQRPAKWVAVFMYGIRADGFDVRRSGRRTRREGEGGGGRKKDD